MKINVIYYIDREKKAKTHMIILTDAEKHIDKIRHSFMIKNSQWTENRGKLPQIGKCICDRLIGSIVCNSERIIPFF